MTGTIFRLARFSVHDGPGLRTTVFLKGCPLRCAWCHSPESQRAEPQLAVHHDRCLVCGTCLEGCEAHAIRAEGDACVTDLGRCRACGACVERCPSGAREMVGRVVSDAEVLASVERDAVFFEESGGGVTFSGGEPLVQPAFLEALLRGSRERRIHAAVDTCGMADPAVFARVLALADLVLFDLKAVDERRHRRITGASNAVILENLRAAARGARDLRVRFPLVPGLTGDDENVRAVGATLGSLGLARIDVLPYHRAGVAKHQRLGLAGPAPDIRVPEAADIARATSVLRASGLDVHVGG